MPAPSTARHSQQRLAYASPRPLASDFLKNRHGPFRATCKGDLAMIFISPEASKKISAHLGILDPHEIATAYVLGTYCSAGGGVCRLSYDQILRLSGIKSRGTLARCLRRLEGLGIVQTTPGRRGRASTYRMGTLSASTPSTRPAHPAPPPPPPPASTPAARGTSTPTPTTAETGQAPPRTSTQAPDRGQESRHPAPARAAERPRAEPAPSPRDEPQEQGKDLDRKKAKQGHGDALRFFGIFRAELEGIGIESAGHLQILADRNRAPVRDMALILFDKSGRRLENRIGAAISHLRKGFVVPLAVRKKFEAMERGEVPEEPKRPVVFAYHRPAPQTDMTGTMSLAEYRRKRAAESEKEFQKIDNLT